MNELKKLLSSCNEPCINKFYLKIAIGGEQRDCDDCIWEEESEQQAKIFELIPILEIEPDE